mmetsp:Transcript_16981/g.55237  ORF Transcript_16981/g.55237 Transcript_16981/m.55237 type:complete len:415 (+) Transcript_16981:3-1247(+)
MLAGRVRVWLWVVVVVVGRAARAQSPRLWVVGQVADYGVKRRGGELALEDALIVDVGMNDGSDVTLPGLARGNSVIAFEPLPAMCERVLSKARAMASQGTIRAAADVVSKVGAAATVDEMRRVVSEAPRPSLSLFAAVASRETDLSRSVAIYGPEGDSTSKMSSTDPKNMPRVGPGTKRGAKAVKVATVSSIALDDVVASKVGLLKVDAQGNELNVLRGAATVLNDPKLSPSFLQFEFVPRMIRHMMAAAPASESSSLAEDPALTLLEVVRAAKRVCFAYGPHVTATFATFGGRQSLQRQRHGAHTAASRNGSFFDRPRPVAFADFVDALSPPDVDYDDIEETDESIRCGRLGCHAEILCVDDRREDHDERRRSLRQFFATRLGGHHPHSSARLQALVTAHLDAIFPGVPDSGL